MSIVTMLLCPGGRPTPTYGASLDRDHTPLHTSAPHKGFLHCLTRSNMICVPIPANTHNMGEKGMRKRQWDSPPEPTIKK
jgi:hypothetical protein